MFIVFGWFSAPIPVFGDLNDDGIVEARTWVSSSPDGGRVRSERAVERGRARDLQAAGRTTPVRPHLLSRWRRRPVTDRGQSIGGPQRRRPRPIHGVRQHDHAELPEMIVLELDVEEHASCGLEAERLHQDDLARVRPAVTRAAEHRLRHERRTDAHPVEPAHEAIPSHASTLWASPISNNSSYARAMSMEHQQPSSRSRWHSASTVGKARSVVIRNGRAAIRRRRRRGT